MPRRLERIVDSYGLPVRPPVDVQSMLVAMRKDKKREGGRIHFVFLDALGSARVEEIRFEELHRLVNAVKMG
jgi:3-dehydroquinate synthase